MWIKTDFFLFTLVYHLNVSIHRYYTALIPDSLKYISLLPIKFLKLDIWGVRCLSNIILVVIDCNMDLLKHICDNEAYCLWVIIGRRKNMIYVLYLTIAARFIFGYIFLLLSHQHFITRLWGICYLLHPTNFVLIMNPKDSNRVELVHLVSVLLNGEMLPPEESYKVVVELLCILAVTCSPLCSKLFWEWDMILRFSRHLSAHVLSWRHRLSPFHGIFLRELALWEINLLNNLLFWILEIIFM